MSRLNFNEMDLSGDESTNRRESVVATQLITTTNAAKRSYALFDINNEDEQVKKKKLPDTISSNAQLLSKDYDITTPEHDDVEEETEKFITQDEYNVDSLISNQCNDIIDQIFVEEAPKPVQYDRPLSSFLSKFLTEKRSYAIVEPLVDLELSNDMYLREFCEGCKSVVIEESEDEDGDSEAVTKTFSISGKHVDDMEDIPEAAGDDDDESFIDRETGLPKWGTVQAFNLPYEVTADKVSELVRKQGLKCKKVTLGTLEKKKGIPFGSAVMDIYFTGRCQTVENIIDILHGRSCGGRSIRVQKLAGDNGRKRASFGSKDANRYFERDIMFKCTKCGEVGHRAPECFNPPLPTPCHLCGGLDHDAGDCVNMVCYRCCQFGHHSRQCRSGNQPRPQICFQCGSTKHDVLQCKYYTDDAALPSKYASLVAGCWVRCMCCGQAGHTMCEKVLHTNMKESHNRIADVYCPNCGEAGHHCDYEPSSKKSWLQVEYCMAPKYDAYLKYPQLLQDIKDIHDDRNDEYYRKIIRHPNDRALFPSLLRPFEAIAAAKRKAKGHITTISSTGNSNNSRNVKYLSDDEEESDRRYRNDRDRDTRNRDRDRDDRYEPRNNNNNSSSGRGDRDRREERPQERARERERSRDRAQERDTNMNMRGRNERDRERDRGDDYPITNTRKYESNTTTATATTVSTNGKMKQASITSYTATTKTTQSGGNSSSSNSMGNTKKRKMEEDRPEEDRANIRDFEETAIRTGSSSSSSNHMESNNHPPAKKNKSQPALPLTSVKEKIVSVTTTAPSSFPSGLDSVQSSDTKWLEKMENRKKRFGNA